MSTTYSPSLSIDEIRTILGLGNGEKNDEWSCVGWAKSKRRRCQNYIAQANRCSADHVVRKLRHSSNNLPELRRQLRKLANLMLCHLHADQTADASGLWYQDIAHKICDRTQLSVRGRRGHTTGQGALAPVESRVEDETRLLRTVLTRIASEQTAATQPTHVRRTISQTAISITSVLPNTPSQASAPQSALQEATLPNAHSSDAAVRRTEAPRTALTRTETNTSDSRRTLLAPTEPCQARQSSSETQRPFASQTEPPSTTSPSTLPPQRETQQPASPRTGRASECAVAIEPFRSTSPRAGPTRNGARSEGLVVQSHDSHSHSDGEYVRENNVRIANATSTDEGDICYICYREYEDACSTPCGHVFCRECISEWLRDHRTCPYDRQPLQVTELATVQPAPLDDHSCAICLDSLTTPVLTPCEHQFCQTCITTWLRRGGTCPLDRRPLREAELISTSESGNVA